VKWTVEISNKARKQLDKLPESIRAAYFALAKDIEFNGPYRSNWSHYGKLKGMDGLFHCHIASGRPTYVVCWEIRDKKVRLVEVYFVGTHEKAPY
jgi:mRNA-degrading endonuclease RelE of RelBE toxin-antitoxin system